jgi:hypothetical protein
MVTVLHRTLEDPHHLVALLFTQTRMQWSALLSSFHVRKSQGGCAAGGGPVRFTCGQAVQQVATDVGSCINTYIFLPCPDSATTAMMIKPPGI